MMEQDNQLNQKPRKQIAIGDLFAHFGGAVSSLKKRWATLVLLMIIGAILGLAYSLFVKPKYTAVCTFVLEDNSHEGMMGQYSGLAALAGIDLAGGGSGLFKGDNIIELYKSRSMIKKTLLSEIRFGGKKQKLIDRYIEFNHLENKWTNENGSPVTFNTDTVHFSRRQDSILTVLYENFNKGPLEVVKPDKKLSIIKVAFTAKDEFFAKNFTDKLVENVNNFYIQTKTKKMLEDVVILQHQADSVKRMLNSSISGVSSAIESSPLVNPILTSLRSTSQKKQVDVQASSSIYGEIVKNLELSKITLRQQTPLIQFIDQPVYPLSNNHVKKLKGAVIGAFLGLVVAIAYFVIKGMSALI